MKEGRKYAPSYGTLRSNSQTTAFIPTIAQEAVENAGSHRWTNGPGSKSRMYSTVKAKLHEELDNVLMQQ